MGRAKKWANNNMRQQAFQLKRAHPDWTEQQVKDEIIREGKAIPEQKPKHQTAINKSTISTPSRPSGNDSTTTKVDEPLPPHLTVDLVEQYLIRLTREDPSAQVAAQLISWLDKRKELKKAEDQLSSIDLAGLMMDGHGTPA